MKRTGIILALLAAGWILSSCVTVGPTKEALLSRWIGQNADAFFLRYGLPVASMPLTSGGKMYQWRSDVHQMYVASGSVGMGSSLYCELTISADDQNRIMDIVLVNDTIGLWYTSRFYEIFAEK